MWSVMFVTLLVTAILFMLLGFYYTEKDNLLLATTFILVTTVLWFTLSAAVIEIEFPYAAIQSNDVIVTGTHVWGDSTAVALMYLFYLMASIEVVYGVGTVPRILFKNWKDWKEKQLGGKI